MVVELPCGASVDTDNIPPDAAEFQCAKGCVHTREQLADGAAPVRAALRSPTLLKVLKPFAVPAGLALAAVGFLGDEVGKTGPDLEELGLDLTLTDIFLFVGIMLMLWGGFFKDMPDK